MLRQLARSSSLSSQNQSPNSPWVGFRLEPRLAATWMRAPQLPSRQTSTLLGHLGMEDHWKNSQAPLTPKQRYQLLQDQFGPISVGKNRRNCQFKDFSFAKGIFQSVDFSHSQFSSGTDFSQGYGAKANFSNCNLLSADFKKSFLNGANFSHARLNYANFEQAKLNSTDGNPCLFDDEEPPELPFNPSLRSVLSTFLPRIQPLRVPYAVFYKAQLVSASFKNAQLAEADFQHADLTNANFENANLQNANLRGAQIRGASFKNANLEGAKIDIASCINDTVEAEGNVAKVVMALAELSATQGLDLGLAHPKAEQQIREIFQAKTQGAVTQKELEADFRHFYKKAERIVHYRELTPDEYLPFIFNNIHHNYIAGAADRESRIGR